MNARPVFAARSCTGLRISRHGSIDISFLERSTDEVLGEDKLEAAQLDRWTANIMKEEAAVYNANANGSNNNNGGVDDDNNYNTNGGGGAAAPVAPRRGRLGSRPEHVTYMPQSRRPQPQQQPQPQPQAANHYQLGAGDASGLAPPPHGHGGGAPEEEESFPPPPPPPPQEAGPSGAVGGGSDGDGDHHDEHVREQLRRAQELQRQRRADREAQRRGSPFRPSLAQSDREKRTLQNFHERMRKAQAVRTSSRRR